jgi:hypothetical protein
MAEHLDPEGVIRWLLEPDNPSARYLALTRLLDRPESDADVMAARAAIAATQPVRGILEAQYPAQAADGQPAGYWVKPDVGYSPKYRATIWQIIFLAQLGVPPTPAIQAGCEYVLDHSRWPGDGRFIAGQQPHTAILCLNGNLVWALQRLGYSVDARVEEARAATVAEVVRYGYACRYNGGLECAWGAITVLRALLAQQPGQRCAEAETAVERGVALLASVPLMEATYPTRGAVSDHWFRLAFPLTYQSDLLEAATVLAAAGYAAHSYMQAFVAWLLGKRDWMGRWPLEQTPGKMWSACGTPNRSNKWVTLRALRAMRALRLLA